MKTIREGNVAIEVERDFKAHEDIFRVIVAPNSHALTLYLKERER